MRSFFFKIVLIFFVFFKINSPVNGQKVLMQGWYWDYPKTADGQNWTDTLASKVSGLSNAGFTHIWLPPLTRSSFGNNSNGYDPKDLFDLGEYGGGATGFGTRSQVDALISSIQSSGMKAVADVVYNHRDGGIAEQNTAVEGWVENYNCTKKNSGDNPYPSDRFRLILPLGGSSGNIEGTYYIKIASVSGHSDYYNKNFRFYSHTNTIGYSGLSDLTESEPNGGFGCGGNNSVDLGRGMISWLDNWNTECSSIGCAWEEFQLTINSSDFNAAGDSLYIYLNNIGAYSDHTVKELYYSGKSGNIVNEIIYQTYTNFENLPSGRGGMNFSNFKPNGNPTNLGGDWDAMLFYYDYDQAVSSTRDSLIEWTKWLIDDVQIEGVRMDAVKHFDYNFTADLLDSLYQGNQVLDMIVGEFFDYDPNVLKGWVDNVENNMISAAKEATQVRVFDFALRNALKSASDQFGYDVRNVFQSGVVDGAGGNSDQVVSFVNNHDFRGDGEGVQNNPELAYAYILTNPNIGLPSVYYPDYFGTDLPFGPDANLKEDIDQLMHIKKTFIDNATMVNYISTFSPTTSVTYNQGFPNTTLLYQVANPSNITEEIITINYAADTLDISFIWPKMLTGTNLALRELTGKSLSPTIIPSNTNEIRLIIPPQSYAVWTTADVPVNCSFGSKVYVDKNASGNNNGSSWTDAFTNLAAAIELTNLCSEIEEIWVKEGNYLPNIIEDRNQGFGTYYPVAIIGGFPGDIANPTIMDRDWFNHPTILNGNIASVSESDNVYHVIINFSALDTVLIDGCILTNGNANDVPNSESGAGVINYGKLKLKNCILSNNHALGEGSGIRNLGGAVLELEDTTVIDDGNTGSLIKNEGTLNVKGANEVKE